ncbi:hypothetical protein PHISCL_04547 [Aspergillus sclerotialis]|uniref:Alcohol acetyltransferase n=1 Tax=Aspergillus sclerotialis TaxID=2070753 RepID=A0A3A2ZKM1_9EURO|nr:hypothetical protein PHISCL_04547 [Aspergillus sclerotialis]
MSQPNTFMRLASPNERRTISREDLGFYNALIIGAVYEVQSKELDVNSAQSFISPLKYCIQKYPYLSVVVKDKHIEKPSYEAVSSINLENHLSIIQDDKSSSDYETAEFEKVLPPILDRPWPTDIPPWRIVVLPLTSPHGSAVARCFIAFSFSHTLGDGMVGLAFHRTFLEAWQQTAGREEKDSFLVTPPARTLPEPFDTPERLPISWKFLLAPLLAAYLPKSVGQIFGLRAAASTIDVGTWTGSRFFCEQDSIPISRVKILEIDPPLVQNALQMSRKHDSKLTGTIHQFIVRALSKSIPNRDVTNFVSQTAVDMRGSIGTPAYTWGLFVSGYYEVHPRPSNVSEPPLPNEMWAAAGSMTKKLAECAKSLQDQAIALLRYAPSIRNWTLGKIGQERDSSYEVSNLLAFDGGDSDANNNCNISKMVFAQPANVLSAPLAFNIVSVKGGSLICTVSWQAGALDVPVEQEQSLVDDICSSIRADFEALGN